MHRPLIPRAGLWPRLAAVVALGLAASCDQTPGTSHPSVASPPRRGGTAVLGSISDVDSWNEYVSQQSFAGNLLRRIYLRLAQEQAAGPHSPESYAPQLAESWSFSPDGLSLTFKLRHAEWSDGEPITAADVRFTWQAQTSAAVPWIAASTKEHITDVKELDPGTVVFQFDRKYPFQFADAVEGGILPEHVFGGIDFAGWATHDWSAAAAVGSGPFLLERHVPGQEIVLQRNLRYFKEGHPLLDRVVVRIVPDAGNLLTQLLSGDIDYMEGITPRDAARLGRDSAVTPIPFDYPQYDYIGWNGSRPPFDKPQIRRAMTLAIDRQALVEDLLHGFGRVSKGPLLSFSWGVDPDLDPWPYDPDEARKMLSAQGYSTSGANGQASGSGRPLEFELMTNSGNRLREEMLVKVQEQLSRIGVRVRVQPLEMKTLRQRAAAADYDAYLGGWVYSGKDDLKPIFGSAFTPPEGANVVFYRSEEADRLLAQVSGAAEAEAMRSPLVALQRRIHEDQPYTFLYEGRRVAAHGRRLAGVEIDIPSDPLARLESFWIDSP